MKNLTRIKLLLVANAIIAIDTIVCTVWAVGWGQQVNPTAQDLYGLNFLRPFTTDSNVFMCVISIITVVVCLKILKGKTDKIPKWLTVWFLAATTCLALTFIVVVFFLAPKEVVAERSYFNMFVREGFFFHFFNPVLSFISFEFLINVNKINLKEKFLCVIPMLIYAVVYITNVVFLQTWRDFYGFTFGGQYYLTPIVLIVMLLVTFLIVLGLSALHNHTVKKNEIKKNKNM